MPETMKLKVDTGSVTIEVTDEFDEVIGTFRINPADTGLLTRSQEVAKHFDAFAESVANKDMGVETVKQIDDDICAHFDYLCGCKVSDTLFSKCKPLSVMRDGTLYYQTCLAGISGIIEETLGNRMKEKAERIDALTAKYDNA